MHTLHLAETQQSGRDDLGELHGGAGACPIARWSSVIHSTRSLACTIYYEEVAVGDGAGRAQVVE